VRKGADARRHERFAIQVPLYITGVEGGTLRKVIRLESKDISAGGVSFETSQKIPLESESRVVVSQVGHLTAQALILGRVARREKDPETGRYIVGLEFTEFVNVTREELMAHIETWKGQPPTAS
jgi:c-di-GMP-binding flagellar brake protein YcgR